jgi:actin-related protein
MFRGFPERIEKEIMQLTPERMKIGVVVPPERKSVAWIGGAVFASLPISPQKVVTHEEDNENEPAIVHQKLEPKIVE